MFSDHSTLFFQIIIWRFIESRYIEVLKIIWEIKATNKFISGQSVFACGFLKPYLGTYLCNQITVKESGGSTYHDSSVPVAAVVDILSQHCSVRTRRRIIRNSAIVKPRIDTACCNLPFVWDKPQVLKVGILVKCVFKLRIALIP